MGFGYKTAWFAVRSTDTQAVLRALRLKNAVPCKGEAGIEAAYGGNVRTGEGARVFVTTPIRGWSLAVSCAFFPLADSKPPQYGDVLARVSAEIGGEAQFFCTHRVSEAHLWARATDGKLRRAYSYAGDVDKKETDFGDPMPEEVALGFKFFDPSSPEAGEAGYWEREDLRRPEEEDVMSLAERWSMNPSTLTDIPDGLLAEMEEPPARPAIATPPSQPLSSKPWWKFW